jgi:glycosyltransferase XagB
VASLVSAREGASALQRVALTLFGVLVLAAATVTISPVAAAALVLSPFYLTHVLYMLGASLERPVPPPPDAPDAAATDWPAYSVLVPLYREARVAGQIVGTLDALQYPRDRLEILFLVEADDPETAAALAAASPPPWSRIMVVPSGGPRTKPNALNHGLAEAGGELVTVFDAEDIPAPDQLARAADMFRKMPEEVVCLQARLVIDNAPDSWLSLMMMIEYAGLFDATKCGFAAMAMPVALGGTSNHFRADALRRLGGWDAWNVAEDAELGLRIARQGLLVADLPSVTQEEAPFGMAAWFAQRRRWLKGFMQTWIIHSRRPAASIRAMGWSNWIGGMMQVGGTVVGALLFPFFSAHVVWHAATGDLFDNSTAWTTLLNVTALWVASCGIMSAIVPALIGLRRRRAWHLAPWLLTLPLYLLLISAAAWVALIDYLREPSRWLKTEHGFATRGLDTFRSRRETPP